MSDPTPKPRARRAQIGTEAYDIWMARGPGSIWGNPFVIGIHGSRTEVIARYEEHVRSSPELMARLPELAGKRLGCFCRPEQRCHVDSLLHILDEQGLL